MESAPTGRIKLHLHRAEVDSGRFSVLTPRPSSPCRVATRAHGESFSIVTDEPGAWFFVRLVWATAFQSRARTVVLIDADSLRADPRGNVPSLPILVVNADLGIPTADDCEQIRAQMPIDTSAPGAVRLVTHGLDRALADPKRYLDEWRAETEGLGSRHKHRFAEVGGVLLFAAPPPVLRRWAFDGARMVAGLESEGGERTESAQLQVVPGLWGDQGGLDQGGKDAGNADAEVNGTGARRVLWQTPTADG